MKKKNRQTRAPVFPDITASEVAETLVKKTATVNLRLTEADKTAMKRAASSLGMTLTEYLTRCHVAVSRHLR